MTTINEIVDGVYRISTFDEKIGLSFNQYLIQDEKPTLVHTGPAPLFIEVLQRIREAVDPAEIAYAFVSHFEADECGALQRLLAVAPQAIPVSSMVTARQLAGFGLTDRVLVQKEGDVLALGRRRLSFIAYPSEVHLWEGLLAFEEADRILFTSDLFVRRGPVAQTIVQGNADATLEIPVAAIPADDLRATCLAKIKSLQPALLALGHGPVIDLRPEPAGAYAGGAHRS
jgi:flavorubredoxin